MATNRRAVRTAAYTSDFNSEAGVFFDFEIAGTEAGGAPVAKGCELSFLLQCSLNANAPEAPPPLRPRQYSRPIVLPPRKPSSEGSEGSMARTKDWTDSVAANVSKV